MPKNNANGAGPVIIIRKKKGHEHGHHGGSWKVALADFMTAMMAFFLLMWLLEAATPKELQAIAGYFQAAPSSNHIIGPGGADAAVIQMASPLENDPKMQMQSSSPMDSAGVMGESRENSEEDPNDEESEQTHQSEEALAEQLAAVEKEQLEALEQKLINEINNTASALNLLKDQIRMEFTELGLSIQIIDKEHRPMFDEGSPKLQDYAEEAILALAPIINKVPNHVSIVGHTDATPYSAGSSYSNWELSSDRANSARRALVKGDLKESKILAVQGMGSVAPMIPAHPTDPGNRRIAIVVLKKAVANSMMTIDPNAGPQQLPGGAEAIPEPEPEPKEIFSEEQIEQEIEEETEDGTGEDVQTDIQQDVQQPSAVTE